MAGVERALFVGAILCAREGVGRSGRGGRDESRPYSSVVRNAAQSLGR